MAKYICAWCGAEYCEETASQQCEESLNYERGEALHMFVEEKEVNDWYFTFGHGQAYPNQYKKLKGTFEVARAKMFQLYGPKWSMQYSEKDFTQIKDRWGLTEVCDADADE